MESRIKESIRLSKTYLGIELGSTRIKSVLIDEQNNLIASGAYDWENSYVDGVWTYSLEDVWVGIQKSYGQLVEDVKEQYDVQVTRVGAIGFSAMMHGYLVFDSSDQQLVPFRTWRNNQQAVASETLTDLFAYPVPQRWSIAHLYQAILNGETHVKDIAYLTTLAGYIHWQLTGQKVLGVGEASGMFPIDLTTKSFNRSMMTQFDQHITDKDYSWSLEEVLPDVLVAGESAGTLTELGAKLIDPSGVLEDGISLCPPEGDAGTGMVATNSVAKRTGNVSAGTSVFAMVVLEEDLKSVHPEIDQVMTPSGDLVAMAHSNNCSSNLDSWINLFAESAAALGAKFDATKLYETLYKKSLEGDKDCGGLMSYGYLSGEHITHFEEGRPLFVRKPDSNFNLANFMRANLFTALGALKIGMDILLKDEGIHLDELFGHGGLFKTEGVGQRYMAAAVNVPVSVMSTAGEGGAWGMALLASFMMNQQPGETLEAYLNSRVFSDLDKVTLEPDQADVEGFEAFMIEYKKGLGVERAAVDIFK